jgi:hypothetical protein
LTKEATDLKPNKLKENEAKPQEKKKPRPRPIKKEVKETKVEEKVIADIQSNLPEKKRSQNNR